MGRPGPACMPASFPRSCASAHASSARLISRPRATLRMSTAAISRPLSEGAWRLPAGEGGTHGMAAATMDMPTSAPPASCTCMQQGPCMSLPSQAALPHFS